MKTCYSNQRIGRTYLLAIVFFILFLHYDVYANVIFCGNIVPEINYSIITTHTVITATSILLHPAFNYDLHFANVLTMASLLVGF